MDNTALKRIFDFLKDKEQQNQPFRWKILNNIPITKEDLNVKGDLDLYHSNITSLPKGLKVGGDLDLYHSKITSLPEGLKVRGYLDLRYSSIESLPKGLKVRDLHIWETSLTKYTDDELREMIKPGFISGKIYRE